MAPTTHAPFQRVRPEKISKICLIGPKGSGKTSLLYTWVKCFWEETHGFNKRGIVRIRPLGDSNIDASRVGVLDFLRVPAPFEENVLTVSSAAGPLETTGVKEIRFEMSLRPSGLDGNQTSALDNVPVAIIDTPGELLFPSRDAGNNYNEETCQEANSRLAGAEAFIVTTPMVDLQKDKMFDNIQETVKGLTNAEHFPNLKRLVLAFTHCERRFVASGNQAFRDAATPAILKRQIQRQFKMMPWRDEVEHFARRPGREVFLTASGSLGFLAGNGSVNIDPHRRVAEAQADVQAGDDGRHAGYNEAVFGAMTKKTGDWRPFLTADPFLCSILGEAGDYAIKCGEEERIIDDQPWMNIDPVVPPPRSRKTLLERLTTGVKRATNVK